MSLFFACDYVGQPTKEPGHKLEKFFEQIIYACLFIVLSIKVAPKIAALTNLLLRQFHQ